MRHLLVFRFSAMGDVALVAPVLLGVVRQYEDVHITLVTRPKFAIFFENMERVTVVAADVDTVYKGAKGLYFLYKKINEDANTYAAIIDLHDHLRTHILGVYFKIANFFTFKNNTQFVVFNKGRKEKKALIGHDNLQQLPHTTQRYADAFASVGFPIALPETPIFQFIPIKNNVNKSNAAKRNLKIGIAPFAKHAVKEWQFSKVNELVIALISEYPTIEITFFGGGGGEARKLQTLCNFHPENTVLAAGKFGIKEEIALMQTLDVMLCMDSSNMHLAALAGVKTVTIWGATHAAAGFAAYGAPHRNVAISPEELPCRPCSVFGDKPCARGDNACMQRIDVEMVLRELRPLNFI